MSEKKKSVRRQLFVDAKIQGALVIRVILYWVLCLLTVTLMLLCWQVLTGPPRTFQQHLGELWLHYGPALLASFLVLPLVMVDVVRLSNRFAGPLLRLRGSMRALARGEHVEPLRFRRRDFWAPFADEFNAAVAHLQREAPQREPQHDQQEELEDSALTAGT